MDSLNYLIMGLDNGIIIKNLPKEDYKYFTNIIDKITNDTFFITKLLIKNIVQ